MDVSHPLLRQSYGACAALSFANPADRAGPVYPCQGCKEAGLPQSAFSCPHKLHLNEGLDHTRFAPHEWPPAHILHTISNKRTSADFREDRTRQNPHIPHIISDKRTYSPETAVESKYLSTANRCTGLSGDPMGMRLGLMILLSREIAFYFWLFAFRRR
jgi:hypothetical protein